MKAFFGWLLMAAGVLMTLTCGFGTLGLALLCGGAGPSGAGASGLAAIVTLGAFPTIFGIGIFVAGLQLYRESRRPRPAGGDHEG